MGFQSRQSTVEGSLLGPGTILSVMPAFANLFLPGKSACNPTVRALAYKLLIRFTAPPESDNASDVGQQSERLNGRIGLRNAVRIPMRLFSCKLTIATHACETAVNVSDKPNGKKATDKLIRQQRTANVLPKLAACAGGRPRCCLVAVFVTLFRVIAHQEPRMWSSTNDSLARFSSTRR